MKKLHSGRNRYGFTLVEIIVVIAIIGLMAGIIGPRVIDKFEKAKVATTQTQMSSIEQALNSFNLDTGRYPTTQEGIQALITNPGVEGWAGNYLTKETIPKDSWEKPFKYQSPGTNRDYDLSSYGKDGTPGGEGYDADINSWE